MKGGSKSKVPVSIWCGHQLLEVLQCISSSWTGPDLSVLAVRCYPTLPPRHLQVPGHFWGGMALALTLRSNRSQTCSMGLRSGLFHCEDDQLSFLSPFSAVLGVSQIYMVTIPHHIHGGTVEKVCAHLLQPNETISFTIDLLMERENLTLLEEKIKEKDFYKCIEFQVPMSNEFVGHIKVRLSGKSFEVENKKKVLITPIQSMTFIQTDKPIYKPGQTVLNFVFSYAVLPKYEVVIKLPETVTIKDTQVKVQVCGKYTYGKPVVGSVKLSFCRKALYFWFPREEEKRDICQSFIIMTDKSGCTTQIVELEGYALNSAEYEKIFRADAELTEEGTGVTLQSSSTAKFTHILVNINFEDTPNSYKQGIPFKGKIKVKQADSSPVANEQVFLDISRSGIAEIQVLNTDGNGAAFFSLNTSSWGNDIINLQAYYKKDKETFTHGLIFPRYNIAFLFLKPFYSKSKSFVKIQDLNGELECETEAKIITDYIIKRDELQEGATFVEFFYQVVAKGGIAISGRLQTHLKDGEELRFSSPRELPGGDINLHLQAKPGSLCSVRSVDKSVLLMDSSHELTADVVYNRIPVQKMNGYDHRVEDYEQNLCFNPFLHPIQKRSMYHFLHHSENDIFNIFKSLGLKLLTNSDVKKPVICYAYGHEIQFYAPPGSGVGGVVFPGSQPDFAKETIRKFFPETWIWNLISVGETGVIDLPQTVPDTITEWQADAFCTSPEGFGLAHPIGLTAFQPFFVELTLPYSVVRGEAFQLKASVFNYLSQCIVVKVSPAESSQYNLEPCEGCEYKSCVCADESKVFRWTFTAKALGEVNITVRAEALSTEELCGNEVVSLPDHGRADTVVQKLLVQVKRETIKNNEFIESKTFSLELPEVFVDGSAKASVSVLGDVMGRAMQNMDKLLAMPFGCGEQNMVLFAPNIYILRYLEATGQMTEQIKAKAIRFMESGYQRELNYKHTDGSYSAFGNSDASGNTWLTAFVMKSFGSARRFVFIDPAHISDAKKWLGRHQLENGCFQNVGKLFHSGMKDTVVALQALALYAAQTYKPDGSSTVTISSAQGFQAQFHLDQTNRLLYQERSLQEIPGTYSVQAEGDVCSFVQLALEYNVPPPPDFSIFNITAEAEGQCNSNEKNMLHLKIVVGYNGNRDRTNMVIVNVKLLSGYHVDMLSISRLRHNPLVKRIDKDKGYIDIYLEELVERKPLTLHFRIQEEIAVKNLKPATVRIYDYYQTIFEVSEGINYFLPNPEVSPLPNGSQCKAKEIYMVTIPHRIHGGTKEKVCAHLLQPNETISFTINLKMERRNLILLEEDIKEKDFYKCIEFQVPMSNEFVGHIEVRLRGKSFEAENKKKVLITPIQSMTFIQTDKPIYKPGQTAVLTFVFSYAVLPKYEVVIKLPETVTIKDTQVKVQTDKSGCATQVVELEGYALNSTGYESSFTADAELTEVGTVMHKKTRHSLDIHGDLTAIGCKIKVNQAESSPVANEQVFLDISQSGIRETQVLNTEGNGVAFFSLNTSSWYYSTVRLKAYYKKDNETYTYGLVSPSYHSADLIIKPFYSISKSFVKIQDINGELECETEAKIITDYIIKRDELEEGATFVEFFYQVELRFSSPRELPGGDTNLHLQAKPGSLCSVRSVDKSVLLMDSSHELTADVIYNRIPFQKMNGYSHKVDDYEPNLCFNHFRRPLRKPSKRYFKHYSENIFSIFKTGVIDLPQIVPDTITEWQADAFCTSPEGFGLAHPIGLTAFQPFFVELTLPYSVVRGEAFQLKASVFNYLSQCIVVKVSPAESSQYNLEPCEGCEYKSCVCADESKVFRWTFTAKALGEVNVTVRAEALNTEELCGNEVVAFPDHGRADTVIRKLLVEVRREAVKYNKHTESNTFSLELPEVFVEGSAKASVSVLGDVIGRAMQNLDKLLAMPFGCGEQNMLLFAPNIYILRYLEATGQMTEQIKAKAIRFMESGYQRELNYKHTDGSYSAFGNSDESGNTWLTAFVMKSFGSARRFIFIDPAHISDAKKWLGKHQQENGCFRNVGKLFHSGMKDFILKNSLSCLRSSLNTVTDVYTKILLSYMFTLARDEIARSSLLSFMDKVAVKEDGFLHWERSGSGEKISSVQVEMTSYVLLSLLSGLPLPGFDLTYASSIVQWLFRQQNSYGGFSSTQDTVVALQALALYASQTYKPDGSSTVTISTSQGFQAQFHLDQSNRLLYQERILPEIPGTYSVQAEGDVCSFVQLRRNPLVKRIDKDKGYIDIYLEEVCMANYLNKNIDIK
ncbi:A2ML1 protein, partial [Polypterus senegalus]